MRDAITKLGLLACAAVALGAASASAETLGLSPRDANAPISVSADQFLADLNSKSGTYSGNVMVAQGSFKLRANQVRVTTNGNKPERILATGNVVFDAPSGIAQGDSGVYEMGPRTITLTGHVVLSKEKNVMRGSVLTVNLVTGVAQLGAKGTSSGRVQALFVPPPQSK